MLRLIQETIKVMIISRVRMSYTCILIRVNASSRIRISETFRLG